MARQIDMEVSIDTTKSELKLDKLQNELRTLKKEANGLKSQRNRSWHLFQKQRVG